MGLMDIFKPKSSAEEVKNDRTQIVDPAQTVDQKRLKGTMTEIANMLRHELGGGVHIDTHDGTSSGHNRVTTNVNINVMFFTGIPEPVLEAVVDRAVSRPTHEQMFREALDDEMEEYRDHYRRR